MCPCVYLKTPSVTTYLNFLNEIFCVLNTAVSGIFHASLALIAVKVTVVGYDIFINP